MTRRGECEKEVRKRTTEQKGMEEKQNRKKTSQQKKNQERRKKDYEGNRRPRKGKNPIGKNAD